MKLLQECGIYVAHCPQSNINVSSGIAPIREFMDLGMNIGLGSDVAGGSSLDIRRAVVDAIGVSKLRWRIMDNTKAALTPLEGLYMATKGGGSYFGKVGSFEPGYEFDAVVIDDSKQTRLKEYSIRERAERIIYLTDQSKPFAKYVKGTKVL